jgi:signal transduction histidine kinase
VSDPKLGGPVGPPAEARSPEFLRLLNDLNEAFTLMGAHLLKIAETSPEPEPRWAAEEAFRLSRGLMADAIHRARPGGCADLGECTGSMLRMLGPVHRAYRTQLSIPVGPIWVGIDPLVLRRVVMNLLLNALEVSPRDRHIIVQVTRSGERASLVFDDAGSGIATMPRTDLGLEFVQTVAIEAGGYLSLVASQRGGARVTLDLPVVPAPPDTLPRQQ